MKIAWAVFLKTWREMKRDLLLLSLSLVFAPLFVILYYLWFPSSGSTTFGVAILNHDGSVSQALIASLGEITYPNGAPILEVLPVSSQEDAEKLLRDRDAEVLLVIPAGFSQDLQAAKEGSISPLTGTVTLTGDLTNPYYAVAAGLVWGAVDAYQGAWMGYTPPVPIQEIALGGSAARSEFETYVPGLLAFAVFMLIFLAAMILAREVEEGTLRRLQITRMRPVHLLVGVSAAVVLLGIAELLLTLLTARLLGFQSEGPLLAAILVTVFTSLSVMGVGLIVAAFSRTVTQAFLIANFPLVLFMFFSGAIYPVPRVELFTWFGHPFGLYDLLPASHGVQALNKIFTLGASLPEVTYEMVMLLILSVLYFMVGVWLFGRMHLRQGRVAG